MHMNKDHLYKLIEKYLTGDATEREREELLQWYRKTNEGDVEWEIEDENEKDEIRTRMLKNIGERSFLIKKKNKIPYVKYAAILALVFTVGWILVRFTSRDNDIKNTQVFTSEQQEENRHLLLPDSSVVLLRPGSKLTYITDFKGSTREVHLEGEAYFDIKSRPHQPFIIHSREVQTTVLGTKFTIRTSDHDGVEVLVREGKVKVEKENEFISELTTNQQMTYNGQTREVNEEPLKEQDNTFEWTELDMTFDAMPFVQLTEKLERRYAVTIDFQNKNLMNCPVSGKFDGTETLEAVLDILCATRNASYRTVKSNQIMIMGEGCDDIN